METLRAKLSRIQGTSLKSEILTLTFGMLLILVTFGDSPIVSYVGNLDTIFGIASWKVMEVVYPVASIAVFLLYGRVNGGIRINKVTIGIFLTFLVALALISIDDIGRVLKLAISPSETYWVAIQWFYPIYSAVAFFIFGRANQLKKIAD